MFSESLLKYPMDKTLRKWIFGMVLVEAIGLGIGCDSASEGPLVSEPITERPDSIALDGVPNVALAVGLSESEYRQVIAGFVDVFKPIAGSQGYELEIIADWNDDQDNAHARTQFDVLTNKVYQIWLPGGTARAVPSADALSAILCHEFGHYAGGFPIMSPALSPTEQLAGEGSSDYYSAF